MASHPLIGMRQTAAGEEAYLLGTGVSVDDVIHLFVSEGGSQQVAELLNVQRRLVDAAIAYHNDPDATVVAAAAKPPEQPTNWLQLITQLLGLVAGAGAFIYVTGAIALSLRLKFEEIPWEPVLPQLPRELVLSIGVGQVLLPSLAVGAVYAIVRIMRFESASPPGRTRWSDTDTEHRRRKAFGNYALTALVLLAPAIVVTTVRYLTPGGKGVDLQWLVLGYLVMLFVAAAVHEVRMLTANRLSERWNKARSAAIMTGIYVIACMPAMTAVAGTLPLDEAKVCTTSDFEERGALVGESGDRIYLGETKEHYRRLAVFPMSQVEELFIGHEADQASCDFGSARLSVTAYQRSRAAAEAAGAAGQAQRRAHATHTTRGLLENSRDLVVEATAVGEKALQASHIGREADVDHAILDTGETAGTAALAQTAKLDAMLKRLGGKVRRGDPGARADLLRQVDRVARATLEANVLTGDIAEHIFDEALRKQPDTSE